MANRLLQTIDPELLPGRFVFVSVPTVPPGVEPVASVVEPDGVSLVLRAEQADSMGLQYEFTAAMITLRVFSALDSVGLTAAVSAVLSESGIACNVVAGYHHDHLFVPHERGQDAVAVLRAAGGLT